jgi:hypothetical protein
MRTGTKIWCGVPNGCGKVGGVFSRQFVGITLNVGVPTFMNKPMIKNAVQGASFGVRLAQSPEGPPLA